MPLRNALGFSFFEGRTGAAYLGEYLLTLGGPFVGLWAGVSVGEISVDVINQVLDGRETSRADHIPSQIGKKPLEQIEPGG